MPPSRRRDSAAISVVRAGMLMPAARVSVANTSFSRPAWGWGEGVGGGKARPVRSAGLSCPLAKKYSW